MSKPKTLLINPAYSYGEGNVWKSVGSVMPPLGLAYIGAILEQHGYPVTVKDFQADSQGFENDLNFLLTEKYDFLGFSATTPQINTALKMARHVKTQRPDVVVIFGGVHPSVMSDEVLANETVSLVVRGEGEQTMLEIVSGKPWAEISGMSYKENDKIIHNPNRPLVENLDDLPDPAYHLLPVEKYHPTTGAYKQLPAISVLATRGCPSVCTYCHRQLGKKIRTRSGKRVAAEVKRLHDNYGIKEICFYDDTFTINKNEVYSFIEELKSYKLPITYVCFSRVDSVDYPLLKAMHDSGCHQICFGVESTNKQILRNIKKGISMEMVTRAVKDTQKAGIEARIALMIGNPGETEETVMDSVSFAIKLEPDLVIFNVTTPYPGTEMFKWADENGCLITKDWDLYDLKHQVMNLPTLSSKEINKLYTKAYRKFYFRPRYVLKHLLKMRTKNDVMNAFNGLRAVLKI